MLSWQRGKISSEVWLASWQVDTSNHFAPKTSTPNYFTKAHQNLSDNTIRWHSNTESVKGCIICLILPAADSHQEELSKTAIENWQAINKKFECLLTNVCNKMVTNGVNIQEFLLFVTALFHPGDCIPPSPSGFTEVFEAISHHCLWDSFHYTPLVRIVRKFGATDPEMKAWIQVYKRDVKAYTLSNRYPRLHWIRPWHLYWPIFM